MSKYALLSIVLFAFGLSAQEADSGQSPTEIRAQKEQKALEDSIQTDSVRSDLTAKLNKMLEPIYANPNSVLALYPHDSVTAYRMHRSDYSTWTDILMAHPDFTAARYSPRSHLSRSLYRGYLIPLTNNANDLFPSLAEPTLPPATSEPQQIERAKLGPSLLAEAQRYPFNQVTPQFSFVWETGLFGGNLLDIRVTRNLTRYLAFSFMISNRNLDRKNYSYTSAGGIEGLYPNNITATNPLSQAQRTNVSLKWQKRNTFEFSYSYSDLRHDIVFQDATNTLWRENKDFLSQATFHSIVPISKKFFISLDGELDKDHNSINNVTNKAINEAAKQHRQAGRTGIGFAPATNDTLTIEGTFTRHETQRRNGQEVLLHTSEAAITNGFTLPQSDLLTVDFKAGYTAVNYKGIREDYPLVKGDITLEGEYLELLGWGSHEIAPITVNYDTILPVTAGDVGDLFSGGGISVTYKLPKLRFTGGYSYITGLKEKTILSYWSDQRTPYSNPGHVFSTSLAFGEWHGFSFYTNWLFSDKRPYVKGESQLSYHIFKPGRTRHLYIDLINSFWSVRDANFGTYNGILFGYPSETGNWNSEIVNLDLKITAEIKSFRLFWKVGNLLHREQSYIPGYTLPGINFRWGFSWSIMG